MGKGIRQGKTGIRDSQQIGAEDPHCLIRPTCAATENSHLSVRFCHFRIKPERMPSCAAEARRAD
jgi:hypothetical protein